MRCSLIKNLWVTRVESGYVNMHFTVLVVLGGQEKWSLVDTGCGCALVRRAKSPCAAEITRMKCVHVSVPHKETRHLVVGAKPLLQLDCPMLI